MHGRGTYTWANGMRYEGDYVEDVKEGNGVFDWPDGRRYEGEWVDDQQHGEGQENST